MALLASPTLDVATQLVRVGWLDPVHPKQAVRPDQGHELVEQIELGKFDLGCERFVVRVSEGIDDMTASQLDLCLQVTDFAF